MSDLVVEEHRPGFPVGLTNMGNPVRGLGPANDIAELNKALQEEGWMGEFAAVASLGANVVSAAFNPIATAVGWVASWIIDHIYPLPDLLQQLTGDPEEIEAGAKTWANIATALQGEADELEGALNSIADQVSETLDAYRNRANEIVQVIRGEADLALGIAGILQKQGGIVEFVYNLVRDLIAEAIGMFTQTVAELVFSVGTATPVVVAQISAWVADKVADVTKWINRGLDAFAQAGKLAKLAVQTLRSLADYAARLLRLVNKPGDLLNDAAVAGARRAATRFADADRVDDAVRGVNAVRARLGAGSGSDGPEIPQELINARGPHQMRQMLDDAGVDQSNANWADWARSLTPRERLEFARRLSGNEARRVVFPGMDPQEQREFFDALLDNQDRARLLRYADPAEAEPVDMLRDHLAPGSGAAGKVADGADKTLKDEDYDLPSE